MATQRPLWARLALLLIATAWASLPRVSGGRLGGESGHRRKDHVQKVPIAASHHLVQEMAAFAVEEFISHSFRTQTYQHGSHFEVLKAERLVQTNEENPRLTARNFYLTIRLYLNGCTVHKTHVVFYPATQTKLVNSRDVDDHHPDCMGAAFSGAGSSASPFAGSKSIGQPPQQLAGLQGLRGGPSLGDRPLPFGAVAGTRRYIAPLMQSRASHGNGGPLAHDLQFT